MKKILTFLVIFLTSLNLWADSTIVYTATEKLQEAIGESVQGLHTKAFVVPISNHTFEDGVGTITFSENLTCIGDYAFADCSRLTSVMIPNSVKTIGNGAFAGCSGLTSITIPNSVTSIRSGAFYGCSGLTSINISDGITSIEDYTFYGCTSLTSIAIPNLVRSIGQEAFYGCSSLTSVTIVKPIISIGTRAFYGCSSLTSLTLPSPIVNIGEGALQSIKHVLFENVINRTSNGSNSYTEGKWIYKGYYTEGYLYFKDTTKTTIVGCSPHATSVTIPNSVTSICDKAFMGCSKLTSIVIPNSVTKIGQEAFLHINNIVYFGKAVGAPWGAKCKNGYIEGDLVYKDSTKTILVGCSSHATSVTIPNSVKRIMDYAFYECSDLTSVSIPISVKNIGYRAFKGCSSLTSVNIPNSVTNIGNAAFSGCKGLTSVTIPNSITSIGYYTFDGCSGLTSVTIPNSVKSIGGEAFDDCTSLTSVTIPNSVKSIGSYAFRNCLSLASVTISNSVTSIGYCAFTGCTGLASVTIPSSVTAIANKAFLSVNNIVYSGKANGAPWGAKYKNGYVDGYLVYTDSTRTSLVGCSSLATSVTVPNSVRYIRDDAFTHINDTINIIYSKDSISNLSKDYADGFHITYTANKKLDEVSRGKHSIGLHTNAFNVPISDHTFVNGVGTITFREEVTSIGDYAFAYCSDLTSVTLPYSAKNIGKSAFIGCAGLTSVVIPDAVTSIGDGAFYGCHSLTSVTIPNSITSIGKWAFARCFSLSSVSISNSVTSIGDYAFAYCLGLTSVTIPNSVKNIGKRAFFSVNNIESLCTAKGTPWGAKCENGYIEGDLVFIDSTKTTLVGCSSHAVSVTIPNSVTSIGMRAFWGCSGLTSVTIPNSVKSIRRWAFYAVNNVAYSGTIEGAPWGAKCENGYIEGDLVFTDSTKTTLVGCSSRAISVTIPNSVTSITDGLFSRCTNLTSVTIGDSVTSIGKWAFYDCVNLTSVTIPHSVKSIEKWAFYDCVKLTSVTIPHSVKSIEKWAFFGCHNLKTVYNLSALEINTNSTNNGFVAYYANKVYNHEPDTTETKKNPNTIDVNQDTTK